MSKIRTATVTVLAAAAATTGIAVAASPAGADSTGYNVCVAAGTPVETGPGGGTTTFTMDGSQAWHVYNTHDNQWTDGYVQNTSPIQRGYVWGGHFDATRTPHALPNGTVGC